MGYLHIDNLYKSQDVLLFREVWATEKIHGTSAHIAWKDGALRFFSGGGKHEPFVALFDPDLCARFTALGQPEVVVFGESYGGKCQAQAWRYGPAPRFVAFDVKICDLWLAVPEADKVVQELGLAFVYYARVTAALETLNGERDAPSVQAARNGVVGDQPREGIVIRPLIELRKNNGERIIAKHKRDDERETRTPRAIGDPDKMQRVADAQAIAQEWVTPMRLAHVLDKLPQAVAIEHTGDVVTAMQEDVIREAVGEIVDSKEARAAIGRATALLWKARIRTPAP